MLKTELLAYQSEENLWKKSGDISNSAGNLALHLLGNLNHFIGAIIGDTGYIRNREAEFSTKHVQREELLSQVEETMIMVEETLRKLDEQMLDEVFPVKIFQQNDTYEYILTHLATHLSYHLGQINYHRRLLDT